ncbi:MAG: mannitol dehydrogenase family protein, partial [Blastomonas fulva]
MRLSADTPIPASVQAPGYDRERQAAGIVHIGIGAFHRAHQAVYTDDAMRAGDRDWGIIGVSLRSGDVAAQLNPQDGLYTVSTRSAAGSGLRLIGAVQKVLVAADDPQAVIGAIAAPTTHIVSFTVTEKGYLRRPDGSLDLAAAIGGSSLYRFVAAG